MKTGKVSLQVFAVFFSAFFLYGFTFGQNPDTIIVDKELVDLIQLLKPKFFYSEKEEIFQQNLEKYLLPGLEALSDPMIQELEMIPEIQWKKERFMKLAEAFFWENYLQQHSSSINSEIDEGRCLHYYNQNRGLFKEPFTVNFWQIWVTDSSQILKAKELLQKKIGEYKKGKPDLSKYSESGFAMNFETNREIGLEHNFYSAVLNTDLLKISDPIILGGSQVFIVLTEKHGGGAKPFMEVKSLCCFMVAELERKAKAEQRRENFEKQFKVIIAPELLKN